MAVQDDRFGYGEDRFITPLGTLMAGCGVLVWTRRNGDGRIISMRHAQAREEAAWFS